MGPEPLAVLLLPCRLEEFDLAAHARALLEIPRVLAVEPRRKPKRVGVSTFAAAGQARRLRFPGQPRVLVLYHPGQYPLARALAGRYEQAELWYLRGVETAADAALSELDHLAQARAVRVHAIAQTGNLAQAEEELRRRLRELEVISHRPFIPGARSSQRFTP